MTIMIVLDSLYKNFNTTIASFLEIEDKMIEQIESILQSENANNISKQAIRGGASNLVMTFRNKGPKIKANNNDKCYSCHKLIYFSRN